MPALGPRHHRVRRLRDLIRDPRARRAEHAFVVEGPRVLAAALDRGADLESAYVGPGAGFTVIGSGLVFLLAALLVIVGFVWYPLLMLGRAIVRRAGRSSARPLDD